MADKKQDFVVSDRRRFAAEGELREDAPAVEEEKPAAQMPAAAPPPAPEAEQAAAHSAALETTVEDADEQEIRPPASDAEQQEQSEAYQASGKKLEEIFNKAGARRESLPEMTFARLIESFYMTALLQLG